MKFIDIRMALALATCLVWCSVNATITFANQKSGFIVQDDARLNLAGATLNNGSIRVVEGGELYTSASAGVAGTPVACTGTAIEIVQDGALINSLLVDGRVTLTGTTTHKIVIGNDEFSERLVVEEGSLEYDIFVEGGTENFPTILEGQGNVTSVQIAGGKYLHLRWNGALNSTVVATEDNSHVVLEQDLVLASGFTFGALNPIYITHLDFAGNTVWLSGTVANKQQWTDANVIMLSAVALNDYMVVAFANDGIVNGQNNSITFGEDSILDRDGNTVILKNIVLDRAESTTILDSGDTGGSWLLSNVQLKDQARSALVTIDGSITNQHPNIIGGATTWGADTILTLDKSLSVTADWTFAGAGVINGAGSVLNMLGETTTLSITLGGDLRIVDTTLANIGASSFVNTSGTHKLLLSNVIWNESGQNSVRITGLNDHTEGAAVTLAATKSGNLFDSNVTFNDAQIDLFSDSAVMAVWTIQGEVVINGNGHTLTVDAGTFNIGSEATLHLRNVVLDQVQTGSLADTTGSLNLSNVTMILGGSNVAWGAHNTTVTVNGPLYVVTGSDTITMPYSNGTTTLNGITAYYDTLSKVDGSNLQGCTGSGRVLFIDPVYSGQDIISGSIAYLETNEYFVAGTASTSPRTLVFNSGSATQYEGSGLAINFSSLPDTLITVDAGTTVTTTNMVLNGFLPDHLGGAGTLLFGSGTTIRLEQDWFLNKELKFGTGTDVATEEMVIDCNGFTIDMSNVAAKLSLNSSSTYLKTLRLCNGRLTKLSGSKLLINNGSQLILENMELVINNGSSSYVFGTTADLEIQGRCVIAGNTDNIFEHSGTGTVTIAPKATLTVADGMTYYHNNVGTENIVFADATSCLELVGAIFQRKSFSNPSYTDKLALTVGTLIIDHASTLQLGDTGIAFGDSSAEDDLSIVFRPSASLHVKGNGSLVYKNTL